MLDFGVLVMVAWLSSPSGAVDVKPAWQWTSEDRLALRYDPEHLRERRRVAEVAQEERGVRQVFGGPKVRLDDETIVVYGEENPELLMPWELFGRFLRTAYAEDLEHQETWRQSYQQQAPHLELDDAFWLALEEAAKDYLDFQRAELEFGAQLRGIPHDERAKRVDQWERETGRYGCRLRQHSLEQARARMDLGFPFDRVLYEAVAPSMFVVHTSERGPEFHRQMAGGCASQH